jgi:hypothetical protein
MNVYVRVEACFYSALLSKSLFRFATQRPAIYKTTALVQKLQFIAYSMYLNPNYGSEIQIV